MTKIILAIVIVLALGAGGFYLLKQKSAPKQTAQASAKPATQAANPASSPEDQPIAPRERTTAGMVNPSATIDAIDSAFAKTPPTLGTDLGAYMADTVQTVIYAAEDTGSKQKKEASNFLDTYLKGAASPWACDSGDGIKDKSNTTARNLEKANSLFKGTLICVSQNRFVAAFTWDDQFLINKIVLVSDYNMILSK